MTSTDTLPSGDESLEGVGTPSGYGRTDEYFAVKFVQGNRVHYTIDLSLAQVPVTLPVPDASVPTEDNRQIRPAHAEGFATYLRKNERWVAPALFLRAPSDLFSFKVLKRIEGSELGILGIPKNARDEVGIIDGQHRILGVDRAFKQIGADLSKYRDLRAKARDNGTPEVVQRFETEIKKLERERDRLSRERIAVVFVIEDSSEAYHQVFVDIADNALGITNAVKVRFDSRKVVNRALAAAIQHRLVAGRVDLQQDRVGGNSKCLLSAKHVGDVLRVLEVGVSGRVSKQQEQTLAEGYLVANSDAFFDVLIEGFPQMAMVADGRMGPEGLRKISLLGSTTMLRVLAGVYYNLTRADGENRPKMSRGEVITFFQKLSPHMKAPVAAGTPSGDGWIGTGVFSDGAVAPGARRQEVVQLVDEMTGWAKEAPAWLNKMP